jgi:chemotaxis protein methyltransferase CheR
MQLQKAIKGNCSPIMNSVCLGNQISDREFKYFQELLHSVAGIYLHPGKKSLVAGRLGSRLRHHGFSSFGDYYNLIAGGADPGEFQVMLDCLTTNETYFFREPAHFDFLNSELRNMECANIKSPVRVWSAACSSGEEVYTLAMVLSEALGKRPWEIVGSDLNQEVLRRARVGHYTMERTSGIDEKLLKKYCLKGTGPQAGTFLVGKELRQSVRFIQVNLKERLAGMGKFDVIFLRNVMIYFNQETKKDLVERIVQLLNPGGLFFVSHSESLHGMTPHLKMIRPSIFRRV